MSSSVTILGTPSPHAGKKHIEAQYKLAYILTSYYNSVAIEQEAPIPNTYLKYTKDREIIPYKFDVYASDPINELFCEYPQIGIEVYGDVGHKHTRRQYKRDKFRNQALKNHYGVFIEVYDTEDLTGRGQRVKGTVKFKPKFTEDDILYHLGIQKPRKLEVYDRTQ